MNFNLLLDQYIVHPVPLGPGALSLVVLGLMLILAFELWMLVDVLALRKVPTKSRVAWVVGMFLVHPFVAMAYLLVRSRYKQVK